MRFRDCLFITLIATGENKQLEESKVDDVKERQLGSNFLQRHL